MSSGSVLRTSIFVFCALLCVMMVFLDQPAHAQDDKSSKSMDKNISERQGVSGSLASGKKKDEEKGVTKVQAAMGIGSVLVMFAVIKWL